MSRRLYIFSVREHLGGVELAAAVAGENTTLTIHKAQTAADVDSQNAAQSAAAIILTYADFDITAAQDLINSLPVFGGSLVCIIAQTPTAAPFLPMLRQRAQMLQSENNAATIIEMSADTDSQQLNETATKLRQLLFAENQTGANNQTIGDNTTMAKTQTADTAVRTAHLAVRDLL